MSQFSTHTAGRMMSRVCPGQQPCPATTRQHQCQPHHHTPPPAAPCSPRSRSCRPPGPPPLPALRSSSTSRTAPLVAPPPSISIGGTAVIGGRSGMEDYLQVFYDSQHKLWSVALPASQPSGCVCVCVCAYVSARVGRAWLVSMRVCLCVCMCVWSCM